jgi:polyhydroxyalkanoate synthesis regulator phasin
MALIDTHKAVKQFTTAGIPEKQAEAITEVISNIDQQVATKSDIARLESKIDIHMKWIMGIGGAMFLMLVKLTFFNS